MKQFFDFLTRFSLFIMTIIAIGILTFSGLGNSGWIYLWWLLAILACVGVWDLLQKRHTLRRNYPLAAHFRWLFERMRPYLRQYIVESDLSGRPYSREQRSLIYERAKNTVDSQPFGSDLDFYDLQFELMNHSIQATKLDYRTFRLDVGNKQCDKPYSASLLNISALSFGALGGNAIEALNKGAKCGHFYHDTGEGGISVYHRRHRGDLVWEIGTGYFGCRDKKGNFDIALFAEQAQSEQVKMIEIKLSQGAKPGHGGTLPGAKVSQEIARARYVPAGTDCISPPSHSTFSTPLELLEFSQVLRERSGGKPVGIKLCVGHPWELLAICKGMLASQIYLDFIVVDGGEGGTGAAPEEFSDHLGMPLRDGLVMTRNALVGTQLRQHVKIAASAKIYSAFSIASNLALGADWCNAGRAFMFSLGCVMSKKCHTDQCPTGITTQNHLRQRGLVVEEKYRRVENFHRNTLQRLAELLGAAGLEDPADLRPHHLKHRVGPNKLETMEQIMPFLDDGVLLDDPESTPYADWWSVASPASFAPLKMTGPAHHRSGYPT